MCTCTHKNAHRRYFITDANVRDSAVGHENVKNPVDGKYVNLSADKMVEKIMSLYILAYVSRVSSN